MHADEKELIARSLHSDATAYGELVDRYKDAVYHLCFSVLHDEAAAEDIAQETFIAAYYKLHQYDDKRRFSTWLFAVATNKSLTYLKQNRRVVSGEDGILDRYASHESGPSEQAERSEIRHAVDALPPKYRTVVSLYYWEGMEYQAIADVLGVPEGTVKGWLHRAKKQLRKELS